MKLKVDYVHHSIFCNRCYKQDSCGIIIEVWKIKLPTVTVTGNVGPGRNMNELFCEELLKVVIMNKNSRNDFRQRICFFILL